MSKSKQTEQGGLASQELLTFHDDFTEFGEHCAFFCESVAGLVANSGNFDAETVRGLERQAFSMKRRAGELKEQLGVVIAVANNKIL